MAICILDGKAVGVERGRGASLVGGGRDEGIKDGADGDEGAAEVSENKCGDCRSVWQMEVAGGVRTDGGSVLGYLDVELFMR